ncbi:unnamed protein product [Pylaiella littoralis]
MTPTSTHHRGHIREGEKKLAPMIPIMTFDALPFDIFRRVASSLDRSDIATLSATDMKRAVLAFCLWERTAVSKGGGFASPPPAGRGGGGGNAGANTAGGYAEDSDAPLGAPIYRFLSPCDAGKELEKCPIDTLGGVGACDAKTILASYPRSGNSLLRRLLEEVTGTITGSDTRPDRTLSRSLSVFGMQGEGVVDHRVRVVKTHYPERTGFRSFEGDRAILLIRNPFDAVDSYFNMALTNTHDQSLHDSVYEEFQEFWGGMIRNEFKVWERFHLHWLSITVPVHVVRYEDLLSTPERTLTDLVAFIHGISIAEVSETFGDRIRNAPAVVNAGRNKSSKQASPSSAAAAAAAQADGVVMTDNSSSSSNKDCAATSANGNDCCSSFSNGGAPTMNAVAMTNNNDRAPTVTSGKPTSTNGGGTPSSNGAETSEGHAPTNSSNGGATAAKASGNGGAGGAGGEADGAAAARSAGTGLYQPRTSGRGVGGSLRKRFSDDQVAWCVRETGPLLRRLGYDPSSQGFPPAVSADLLELDRLQSLYTDAARDERGHATASTASTASIEGESGVENGEIKRVFKAGFREVAVLVQPQSPKTSVPGKQLVTVNDDRSAAAAAAAAAGARWGGVRDERDAYGRAMTPFRRSHTQLDTRPLPLKGEDLKAEKWRRRRRAEKEARGAHGSISGGSSSSSNRQQK